MPAKNSLWLHQTNQLSELAGRTLGLLFQSGSQDCLGHPFSAISSYRFLQLSFGDAKLIAQNHDFQVLLGFSHVADSNEGDEGRKNLSNQKPNHQNAYSNSRILMILPESKAYFHLALEKILVGSIKCIEQGFS